MATSAYVETLCGGIESLVRKAIVGSFTYALKNLRWGRPGHQEQAENLQAVFLQGTTPAVANTEFSIEHGLATTPYLVIPVLDLQTVGSTVVRLQVSRAPDERRIYLQSPDASAAITVLCEG